MEHVAIDLGRPSSVLAEFNSAGARQWTRFRLEPAMLMRLFAGRPKCRVLIEASTDSEWVAQLLEGVGHEVMVADPNYAPMYGERNRNIAASAWRYARSMRSHPTSARARPTARSVKLVEAYAPLRPSSSVGAGRG